MSVHRAEMIRSINAGTRLVTSVLRQWLDEHGYSDVRQPDNAAHDALSDARWIAGAHNAIVLATNTTRWGGPLSRVSVTTQVAKDDAV